MTIPMEPVTISKVQLVLGRFNYRNWRCKQIDRNADVYMVHKPDFREYCYFIAFTSDDQVKLLPEETNESFKEAKSIIKEALKQ